MCPMGLCPPTIQMDHRILQAHCSTFQGAHSELGFLTQELWGWENPPGASSLREALVLKLK